MFDNSVVWTHILYVHRIAFFRLIISFPRDHSAPFRTRTEHRNYFRIFTYLASRANTDQNVCHFNPRLRGALRSPCWHFCTNCHNNTCLSVGQNPIILIELWFVFSVPNESFASLKCSKLHRTASIRRILRHSRKMDHETINRNTQHSWEELARYVALIPAPVPTVMQAFPKCNCNALCNRFTAVAAVDHVTIDHWQLRASQVQYHTYSGATVVLQCSLPGSKYNRQLLKAIQMHSIALDGKCLTLPRSLVTIL